ncbi:MAG: hypothetical protein KDJ73_11245 [Notoacmeibacter sp.]|nr:hypothetical protein [Notoacmeibacter sp.]MCC0032537.1 hypothetical protein [Brucellaceae bacterium]
MGRLAGPTSRQRGARDWKAQVEFARAQRVFDRPPPPVGSLPKARRRSALLAIIGEGMMVGWRHTPPLTPGLRDLLDAGLAGINRRFRTPDVDMSGRNVIVPTPKGRAFLAANPADAEALAWISQAIAARALP